MNYILDFEELIEIMPCALYILSGSKIIKCNKAALNIFGYDTEDEIIGMRLYDLSPESQEDGKLSTVEGQKIIESILNNKYESLNFQWVHKKKDESTFLANIEIHNKNGILYILMLDITSQKSYERNLHLFRKVLENNTEGVVITNIENEIKWTNSAFEKITGYAMEEVMGKNMKFLKSGIHEKSFYQDIWNQLEEKGTWSGEIWNKNKSGDNYSEWLTINGIKLNCDKTTHYVGIFKDLSEKKMIDRKISDLRQKDSLTKLYNRNYFLEIVDKYIGRREEAMVFAIIFIDLDRFKDINDSIGHVIGDKLLIELSNRLLNIKDDNYIVSRSSGDEFVILYKDIIKNNLNKFLAKIIEQVNMPFEIGNNILHISVNIGVSKYPENGHDAEALVRYADIAMSKAKNQIDDKICFYTNEMSEDIEMQFHINNYLVGAISNNELSIHYQPIFDINKDNTIKGAEALLRWTNPILGNIPPSQFIVLAEKTGQIITIGEWVLDNVCKQINLWKSDGYSIFPVAVNISVKQLEKVEFAKTVIDILEANGVNPEDIELEITESISTGDIVTIIKNLKILKQIGIKISMDDFGTGFSSLGQLDLFELDKIKIDKIFIEDLVNVAKRQKLVKSIIAMAGSLDLTVVAEGIETYEQLSYLKELGCHLGQGYLFSKPLPPDQIEILLDNIKKDEYKDLG